MLSTLFTEWASDNGYEEALAELKSQIWNIGLQIQLVNEGKKDAKIITSFQYEKKDRTRGSFLGDTIYSHHNMVDYLTIINTNYELYMHLLLYLMEVYPFTDSEQIKPAYNEFAMTVAAILQKHPESFHWSYDELPDD